MAQQLLVARRQPFITLVGWIYFLTFYKIIQEGDPEISTANRIPLGFIRQCTWTAHFRRS